MRKYFSLPVSKINIEEINNGDFLSLDIYAISDKENRNKSEIIYESFESGIQTMYNKPILAFYNTEFDDVEEHNSRISLDKNLEPFTDYQYHGAERPVGIIPESCNIAIEKIDSKHWIVLHGVLIWAEYNRQLIELLKEQIRKKVSVEIEVLESCIENDVEKIKSWKLLGITILGKTPDGFYDVQEGIKGAKLVLSEYANSDNFKNFKSKLSFALKDKDNKFDKYLDNLSNAKFSITLSDLEEKVWNEIRNIDVDCNGNTDYYVKDILFEEYRVILVDEKSGILLSVPYHIEGDKLSLDFDKAEICEKEYIVKEYSKELFFKKEDWGTKKAISVNKSKESISDTSWKDINKIKLRNSILKAKNYKKIVHDVYLLVEDGWENAPSSKLKYPVMQIKDHELVYNAEGLLIAQIYSKQYNKKIWEKVKSIREKLGLVSSEKRESMKKFVEDAKGLGFVLINKCQDKMNFAKEIADNSKESNTVYIYSVEKTFINEYEKDKTKKISSDDFKAIEVVEPVEDKETKEKYDNLVKENKELSEKLKNIESEKETEKAKSDKENKELSEKLEMTNKELKEMKYKKFEEDTDAILEDEDENTDEKTKDDLRKMRKEGKFETVEDFIKEMMYRKYTKSASKKSYAKNLSFSLYSKKEKKESEFVDPDIDELDKI